MKSFRPWLGLVTAILLLLVAFGWLFQVRLGSGDVYPEYSSLRADALGTRAWYEALDQIPGLAVSRDYRPLERLRAQPGVVILPGLFWRQWQSVPANRLEALDHAAASGARIILAFRAELKSDAPDESDQPGTKKKGETKDLKKDDETKDAKTPPGTKEQKNKKSRSPEVRDLEVKELEKVWGVKVAERWLFSGGSWAERDPAASADLPQQVAWHSDVHFLPRENSGWKVLYRRAGQAVAIERAYGRGSVVLLGDAYCLSNEAMSKSRATSWLTYLIGRQRRVVFLEGALGVLEDNGLGFLARRYGLGGALALCVLLGVLYAWRRLVSFLPPRETAPLQGTVLASETTAGFTGLLRRSLGRNMVLTICVEEWRKSRYAGGANSSAAARLDSAWKDRDPKQAPAAAYNALVRALKSR